MIRCLSLLLVACATAEPSALPTDLAGPSFSILLGGGASHAYLGRDTSLSVTGSFGDGEPVYLGGSLAGLGSGPCPPVLGGTCLDLLRPQIVGQAVASGGVARFVVSVPAALPEGTELHFQAVVVRGLGGRATVTSEPLTLTARAYVEGCTNPAASNYDAGATFDDGSCVTSINPTGTVLVPGSDFVDPSPPSGWTQCAGFVNTSENDVSAAVLDNCLNTTRLRLRVWDAAGNLSDDLYVDPMSSWSAWPDFNYLGGTPVVVTNTLWNGTTTFFTSIGGDACAFSGEGDGVSLGNGSATTLNVMPGHFDPEREIRINCGGVGLLGYTMALYR